MKIFPLFFWSYDDHIPSHDGHGKGGHIALGIPHISPDFQQL